MPYQLKELTIRTNNTPDGLAAIAALWADVASGKLPLLFDSEQTVPVGVSLVSKYSNYESDHTGDYDLSLCAVRADFFQDLEQNVAQGLFQKYEESDPDGDLAACTQKAWAQVWAAQAAGRLGRAFTTDFECAVPAAHTKDGSAHCCLYLAVK